MTTSTSISQVKRVLADGAEEPNKRPKTQSIEVVSSEDGYSLQGNEDEKDGLEEEDVVDLLLTIGRDDGDDYNIVTTKAKDDNVPSPADEGKELKTDPPSPCLSSKTLTPCPSDEALSKQAADSSDEEPLLRVNSNGSLGNNLKISLKALLDPRASDDRIPTPLITPPACPKRIRTMSIDGAMTEETTICEWPSGLTVDSALISALESAPLR